jgi:Ca2+/H+ antiporter
LLDGETNWFEKVQLVALYLIAAVSFFFLHALGAPGGRS